MRVAYMVGVYVVIGFGAVHAALTPLFYPQVSPGALWFAGTGLALVFLGLLNWAALRSPYAFPMTLCLVANVIGLAYGVTIAAVVREPQAFAALPAFATMTVGSIVERTGVFVH